MESMTLYVLDIQGHVSCLWTQARNQQHVSSPMAMAIASFLLFVLEKLSFTRPTPGFSIQYPKQRVLITIPD